MNTAVLAPSSRGLGHRPFKARTPVRIRLGLPKFKPTLVVGFNFAQSAPTGCARVPRENAVFVGNAHRHAWRIRRRTISKPAKTDMFNRVFASRFGYWLSRRDVGAAKIDKTANLAVFYLPHLVSITYSAASGTDNCTIFSIADLISVANLSAYAKLHSNTISS